MKILPELTGVFTTCKICNNTKDDAEFKWSGGKRVGLVCRECDRTKKRNIYANDEVIREQYKSRSCKYHNENRDAVLEKMRQRRNDNIDYYREQNRKYQQTHRNQENQRSRDWYSDNKDTEKYKDYIASYRLENRDINLERMRAYYDINKEKLLQTNKIWRKANRKLTNAYFRNYMLSKKKRMPKWADVEAIKCIYRDCEDGYEVDHIIPLHGKLVSGLHVETNLQYLTESENSKKSNKFNPETFVGP